ncbi:MAG: hypothetical protein ACXADX_20050, partial [Candidatus Hodarchaeales archaeon]
YILVELKEKLDSCSPISMKELAANIDITPKKLKAILEGEKEPCDKVLAYLSIDKVVGYRRRR